MHVDICMCVNVCIHVCIIYMYTCVYIYEFVSVYVCFSMYIYVDLDVYMCVIFEEWKLLRVLVWEILFKEKFSNLAYGNNYRKICFDSEYKTLLNNQET